MPSLSDLLNKVHDEGDDTLRVKQIGDPALPTGAATEATLAAIKDTDGIKKILDALPAGTNALGKVIRSNVLIPADYDYVALTYVAAGNGAGKVETATFKTGGAGGDTVGTLTLTYDANHRVETVERS